MTLRALVTAPETYRVGVCIYGVGDLYDHMARAIEPYMGDLADNADAYEAASSLKRIDELRGKLLLIHGTNDVNATFSATMKIVDRLIEADKPFDLLVVPEMAHGMLGKGREYTIKRVGEYFVQHLGIRRRRTHDKGKVSMATHRVIHARLDRLDGGLSGRRLELLPLRSPTDGSRPSSSGLPSAGDDVIDVQGRTVLPGLVNAHTHFAVASMNHRMSPGEVAAWIFEHLRRAIDSAS